MDKFAQKIIIVRSIIAFFFLTLLLAGCATSMKHHKIARYEPKVSNKKIPAPTKTNNLDQAGKQLRQPIRLRSGDEMSISLRGIPRPEDVRNVVDSTGTINLPFIGTIKVEGLTSSEAEKAIEKAYIEGDYYKKINVIIVSAQGEYFVGGEVKNEGKYSLSGDLTLLQAITVAGGYTDYAKRTQTKIKRGNKVMYFNIDKIEKIKAKDPLIKSGDIITVPRRIFL